MVRDGWTTVVGTWQPKLKTAALMQHMFAYLYVSSKKDHRYGLLLVDEVASCNMRDVPLTAIDVGHRFR